jgi:hypothetical protein
VTDDRYLRELVVTVEQRRSVLHFDWREQVLYAERLDELPDWLQEALRQNVGPLTSLVSRIGTRVGFRYGRTRWHVAINRFGYLESLCGIALLEQPRPIRELPPSRASTTPCACDAGAP